MVFDLLKVGRGEDTSAHYVVTLDLETLGVISDAAVFMACRSEKIAEVTGGVDLVRVVTAVIAKGKDELRSGSD